MILNNDFFSFNVTGKILNNETTLKEYKIDEKNFVVVMVTKVSVSGLFLSSVTSYSTLL